MKLHPTLTADRIADAAMADDNIGFCIHCGAEVDGIEPDARDYPCPHCRAGSVFGAEELLLETF